MNRFASLLFHEDGQALTEYGLILGLLAVACVAAVTTMGGNIRNLLQSIATAIGGAAGGGSTP